MVCVPLQLSTTDSIVDVKPPPFVFVTSQLTTGFALTFIVKNSMAIMAMLNLNNLYFAFILLVLFI
jgi:hypothetical protein